MHKDKVFFFVGFQHRYNSDQGTGLSQLTVPSGLTDDRSTAGLDAAAASWNNGTPFTKAIDPIAAALMNAKLPDGSWLIPSAPTPAVPYQFGVPNVNLIGTSILTADQATSSVDWDVSKTDRFSVKYYYQNAPVSRPYSYSQTGGFPVSQNNGSQVAALDNTISLGSRLNWEQRLGFARMGSYGFYKQTLTNPGGDSAFGIGDGQTGYAPGLPGLLIKNMANAGNESAGLKVGPYSSFANMGFYQNRLNPSTNLIFIWGKHTLVAGGGYDYTQLNITNNRTGIAQVEFSGLPELPARQGAQRQRS